MLQWNHLHPPPRDAPLIPRPPLLLPSEPPFLSWTPRRSLGQRQTACGGREGEPAERSAFCCGFLCIVNSQKARVQTPRLLTEFQTTRRVYDIAPVTEVARPALRNRHRCSQAPAARRGLAACLRRNRGRSRVESTPCTSKSS